MLNAKDARALASILREADVYEEVAPLLNKRFPTVDWEDLIKLDCPKCGKRSRLVGVSDCLHCVHD